MNQKTVKLLEEYLQADGTLLLPQSNNWFLKVDPEDPDSFECYTTKVDGDPTAERKIHSARIHPGPPYKQLIFDENDVDDRNTVGAMGILIWIGPDGAYIAGRENQRHNGKIWEAWRKSWSSDFNAPAQAEHGMTANHLTDKHLGRGIANTARGITPEGLAMIAYQSQILVGTEKPELTNEGEWKEVEWFMLCSLDQMGKAVLGAMTFLGYLKPNKDKLEKYKDELVQLIEVWSK